MDSGAGNQTPLDLRRASPSLTPTTYSKTVRVEPQNITQSSNWRNDQLNKTMDQSRNQHFSWSGREEGSKRSTDYSDNARHPLKRRRIAFLKQMKESKTNVKTLKPSPSDSSLSLSWTARPNRNTARGLTDNRECMSSQIPTARFCMEMEKPEPYCCPKEVEFNLGDNESTCSRTDIQPRVILENCEEVSNSANEKNVSRNTITDYITRCRFSKKAQMTPNQQRLLDYTDFQNIERPTVESTMESETTGEGESGPKMSALDFLMSKFLMNKDDKPFSVRNEHANAVLEGKKKGTLNLLDVMELQVELGLA